MKQEDKIKIINMIDQNKIAKQKGDTRIHKMYTKKYIGSILHIEW